MKERKTTGPELSLVMPCYNEEACIGETAPELVAVFREAGVSLELVLVDNGSTDGTGVVIDRLVASGMPVRKVRLEENRGYGNGILTGLRACRAPLIGYLCADGQVSAADVLRVYDLTRGRENRILAKVRRRFREDSLKRKIVSIIYNGLMQLGFGWLGAIDINGSPKVFSRRTFEAMELRSTDWFLDPEIVLKAKALGLRIIEIDAEGHPRRSGFSHVRRSTILEFLRNMWRYRTGNELREWRRRLGAPGHRPDPDRPAPSVRGAEARERVGKPDTLIGSVRTLEQPRYEDGRGYLQKILQSSQWRGRPPGGEVYVVAARPGQIRGNHYHRKMGEWFAVVQGTGALELLDPVSGERGSVALCAARPRTVFVPAGLGHALVNRGEELLICVAWAEAEHDPADVVACHVASAPAADVPRSSALSS